MDGLIALRILVARLRREQGRGWMFYCVLLYTSAIWVAVADHLVRGRF